MRIEFAVTGVKPAQRRRTEVDTRQECSEPDGPSVAPVVRTIVLAYQIEQAIRDGRARDYADIARQTGLTRARVSQITRLLRLPHARLESLLLADHVDPQRLTERRMRALATEVDAPHRKES